MPAVFAQFPDLSRVTSDIARMVSDAQECPDDQARGCGVVGHCASLSKSLYQECLSCGFDNPAASEMTQEECSKCFGKVPDVPPSRFIAAHAEFLRNMPHDCPESLLRDTVEWQKQRENRAGAAVDDITGGFGALFGRKLM